VAADAIDDPASPTTPVPAAAVAAAAVAAAGPAFVATGGGADGASVGSAGGRGSGRASTAFASALPATVVARAQSPRLGAPLTQDSWSGAMARGAKHHAGIARADAPLAPGAVVRSLGLTAGGSAFSGAVVSARVSGGRPARSVLSSGGRGGLPVPSPFGPPGRGSVAAGSGAASAAAGSGVVSAMLVAGLVLLGFSQLRRFRLAPVLAGPVGVVSLQQRPG